MQTILFHIFMFWLIFSKISPRWSKSRDKRIILSFFATLAACFVISGCVGLFLLAFFPEYCYGL
ncbi:MAG: hypothetical protein IKY97_08160 [Mailhella sp.]|nr:hypothetical protein [Mailhella sp.]